MRTALAAALARNVRVASIAVAAAVLGASGAAATVATVADTTPSAGPSAEASAGHPSDEADDADEPAGTETSKPKAAKGSAKPKHGASTAPTALFDPAACAAALHHGDYVAQVAAASRGTADRGALVSAAARSDCGKPTRPATGAADDAEHGADGPGTSAEPGRHHGNAEHRAAPHGKSAEHRAAPHGKSAEHAAK